FFSHFSYSTLFRSAVQLAAVDHLEVMIEGEMPGDLAGEYRGFGSGDIERAALATQVFEHLQHAVEQEVLVETGDLETLTVMPHRLPRARLVEAIELHECLQQRRADERLQLGEMRLVDAEPGQRMLYRPGDAVARIGQGAVEIEKDGGMVHGKAPTAGMVVDCPVPVGIRANHASTRCGLQAMCKRMRGGDVLFDHRAQPIHERPD